MAYYTSNYHQNLDGYQYYNSYYSHDFSEPRYVGYYDTEFHGSAYDYYDTEFHGSAYQHAPTPSRIGYYYSAYEFPASKKANYDDNFDYYDPVSTEIVVSRSTNTKPNDLDFEEYNPEPFHGGYDIDETYGKAMPPSDEICYPPSKIVPNIQSLGDFSYGSVPSPYGKEDEQLEGEEIASDSEEEEEEEEEEENLGDLDDEEKSEKGYDNEPSKIVPIPILDDSSHGYGKEGQNLESEAKPTNGSIDSKVIQEENVSGSEEDEEEDEEEEENRREVDYEGRNEEDYGKEIRRLIPPGYGIEAMDLCESVFGGYFPCLWKRSQGNYNQIDGGYQQTTDDNCWKETADYLFGNPNPYGEPVYSYQRHYTQQPLSEQVECEGNFHGGIIQRYYY